LVNLGDGRVLAASGLLEANGATNPDLEIYSPGTDSWKLLHAPHGFPALALYAHLFLMADGRIFFSGGRMDDASPLGPCLVDATRDPFQVVPIHGLADPASRNQSASVLAPPGWYMLFLVDDGGVPSVAAWVRLA
ncbi:MAG: galactose oxidase-like domain-containing protein, partial [Actinomycetota bacterium]